ERPGQENLRKTSPHSRKACRSCGSAHSPALGPPRCTGLTPPKMALQARSCRIEADLVPWSSIGIFGQIPFFRLSSSEKCGIGPPQQKRAEDGAAPHFSEASDSALNITGVS